MKNIPGSMINYLAAASLLAFGMIYLLKGSFMPYHGDAVSLEWKDVPPAMQYLLLALMRATSGGFIAVAVAIAYLQYRFTSEKIAWIPGLILVLGTIPVLCYLYAILLVGMHTPGKPPLVADILGEVLLIAGFLFNRRYLSAQE